MSEQKILLHTQIGYGKFLSPYPINTIPRAAHGKAVRCPLPGKHLPCLHEQAFAGLIAQKAEVFLPFSEDFCFFRYFSYLNFGCILFSRFYFQPIALYVTFPFFCSDFMSEAFFTVISAFGRRN